MTIHKGFERGRWRTLLILLHSFVIKNFILPLNVFAFVIVVSLHIKKVLFNKLNINLISTKLTIKLKYDLTWMWCQACAKKDAIDIKIT